MPIDCSGDLPSGLASDMQGQLLCDLWNHLPYNVLSDLVSDLPIELSSDLPVDYASHRSSYLPGHLPGDLLSPIIRGLRHSGRSNIRPGTLWPGRKTDDERDCRLARDDDLLDGRRPAASG